MRETVPRIGVLAFPRPGFGGIFQYTQGQIDALAGRPGLEVVVFTVEPGYETHGLEVRALQPARRSLWRKLALHAALQLRSAASWVLEPGERALLADIDCFLVPSSFIWPHLLLDTPFVVTIHDLQERYLPGFFSPFERALRAVVNPALARKARRVLCETRFVRDDLVRFAGADPARIDVLAAPPPAALAQDAPTAEQVSAARRKHGLVNDYLFYPTQQFWPHKNHATLLSALSLLRATLPALELVLTGKGSPGEERVLAQARALGVTAAVRVLPYLPYAELKALFCGARALVMPSLFESVSIPIYEAFALGVPVCAARVVGLPEQVGEAGLLFDPHDPRDLARAVSKVLEDPRLAAELVARGHLRVAPMTVARHGEALERIIRSALAPAPA